MNTVTSASLTMTSGPRAGTHYPLDSRRPNLIGRGLDCHVILTDGQCSRVHAKVVYQEGTWWLYDAESRNGTFVNSQKIDEAQLLDGNQMRVGSTVFKFQTHATDETGTAEIDATGTIILDEPVDPHDTGNFGIEALQNVERAEDFLTLYQLSIRLLGCDDPDEVVSIALDLLHDRTQATVVGFLWVSDDGQLRAKSFVPSDAANRVTLSRTLTQLVIEKGHAVRFDNQSLTSQTKSLSDYADTICVPLIRDDQTLGAVHLYRSQGVFGDGNFEFAKSLANIMVAALVRARRQASLIAEHHRLVEKTAYSDELIGDSEPMQQLKSKIGRIARANGCVLVRGESGSGKELVARALHRSSPRADRPLLSVNCAAIPTELMESQLFGHKKGAFTSAESDHAGWFQQADSGTLFLDEVGELTLEGQAKLLRILEGHPFLPVGGTKELNVDVRVIAATNRDLREFVSEKHFREDLYYRLSVFELFIPPFRDRGPDIELLVNHFFEHFKAQHGRPKLELGDEARTKLLSYQWPGNVRQLRNVIDSAIVMAENDTIESADLAIRDAGGDDLESLRVVHWERKLIKEALSRTRNSVPEAAKLVGLGRATLYRKIEEYGIERK
jgi:two-component system response regulator HydG